MEDLVLFGSNLLRPCKLVIFDKFVKKNYTQNYLQSQKNMTYEICQRKFNRVNGAERI